MSLTFMTKCPKDTAGKLLFIVLLLLFRKLSGCGSIDEHCERRLDLVRVCSKERPMSRRVGRYGSIAIASKVLIAPRTTISGSVRGSVHRDSSSSRLAMNGETGFHGAH